MILKNIKKDKYLIFLILSISIIGIILVNNSSIRGIMNYTDAYYYLTNALNMIGYSDLGYKATMSFATFLTGIIAFSFKLGFVNENIIFILSGIFYLFSAIGLYLLFKIKYDERLSLMGALSFATFSIVLKYAGSGVIDIHATCMSIWTLYFGILAIEKNSKYFYLAFPFFVLSMFTRYTTGLIILLIGLYLIFNGNPIDYIKNNIKNIFGGIITGILTTLPFIYYFIVNRVPLRLFDQSSVVLSKTNLAVTALTVKEADYFFYIGHIIKFVSGENPDALLFSHITRAMVLLFVFFVFLIIIKNFYKENYYTKLKNRLKNVEKKTYLILNLISIIVISFVLMLIIKNSSIVLVELIIFLDIYLIYLFLTKFLKLENLSMEMTMITLFISYIVFFTLHREKVDRYIITVMPSIAYFFVIMFKIFFDYLKSVKVELFKNRNIDKIIAVLIIAFMLISTIPFLEPKEQEKFVKDRQEMAKWIKGYDPDYETKEIWGYRANMYSWYLKTPITYVTNKMIVGPPNFNDGTKLNEALERYDVDYYIDFNSKTNTSLNNYKKIKVIGNATLYGKN